MANRCSWTNEESDGLKEIVLNTPDRLGTHPKPTTFYVLPEYEQKLRRFMRHFKRFGLAFLFSILILSIALPIVVVMRRYTLLGVVVLGFGSSIVLVRAMGFIVMFIGSLIAATA